MECERHRPVCSRAAAIVAVAGPDTRRICGGNDPVPALALPDAFGRPSARRAAPRPWQFCTRVALSWSLTHDLLSRSLKCGRDDKRSELFGFNQTGKETRCR